MSNNETNVNPEEVSFDDAEQEQKLQELLAQKAQEKLQLSNINGLLVLTKSKFFYGSNGELREHIASYNGYAIMIKQEKIKEDINVDEATMFPSLVLLKDLKKMKKVNGNVVRRLQPQTIHEYEKMALIHGVVLQIDKGI